MKLGIIRCLQTEHRCGGTKCLIGAQNHQFNFAQFADEPIEVVGMVSCGGCPGKNVDARAELMVQRGADAIALASCITKGNPINFPCPHRHKLETMVKNRLGETGRYIDHTHE